MRRSFEAIDIGLMVGIAGGAPSKKHDIRLGDVVVSQPMGQRGGVFHYGSGKMVQNKEFAAMGSLNSPPESLLTALLKLSSLHKISGHNIKSTVENMLQRRPRLKTEYQKPDLSTDVLYKSSFIHSNDDLSCAELCFHHKDEIVDRPTRDPKADDPMVHFGLIASGDQLMKDASIRDALIEKEDVLCFEMEAAGLMGRFPCLVIRGICDYSDTHKNKVWQGYAAATAAAYAKELLVLALPGKKIREEAAVEEYNKED
jgi:nucleoside phosphorylase